MIRAASLRSVVPGLVRRPAGSLLRNVRFMSSVPSASVLSSGVSSTTQNAAAPLFVDHGAASSVSAVAEAAGDAVASAAPAFASVAADAPTFAANAWEFGLWPHSVPILNNLPATVETILRFAHDYTGLPWWATIAVVGISMRCCVFPLTLSTMKQVAIIKKMEVLATPYKAKASEAQKAVDADAMKKANAELKAFYMLVRPGTSHTVPSSRCSRLRLVSHRLSPSLTVSVCLSVSLEKRKPNISHPSYAPPGAYLHVSFLHSQGHGRGSDRADIPGRRHQLAPRHRPCPFLRPNNV